MIWVIIIIIAIVLDRVSKMAVVGNMVLEQSKVVMDKFFYITYWENKGAAWGIFQNGRYFFIAITILTSIVLAVMLYKSDNKLLKLSLSFILGGAVGNLIDRTFRGSVIDFFDFYIGSYNFPIFNVADTFVVIGTFLLAYFILFIYKEEKVNQKE